MKILLISPVIDLNKKTPYGLKLPSLSLYILKGLTPKKHTVDIVEEEFDNLDFDGHFDLVGISCMTANAPRAYEIAKKFKEKGATIIMGGAHPSIMPEEVLNFADIVVIGEAEGVWGKVLVDFENNKLKRIYNKPESNLNRYVVKDFKRLSQKSVNGIIPLLFSRGCPYRCNFCCVRKIYGSNYRTFPIENIVRDIKESKAKTFIFLDDNLIVDRNHAKKLFKALIPLKIKWLTQVAISAFRDLEILELAKKSGCIGIYIGLEGISRHQRIGLKKNIAEKHELENILDRIRRSGIFIHASIIFGFDTDDKDLCKRTTEFLIKNNICSATFMTLTPLPGTELFDKFKAEKRLLDLNWTNYDMQTLTFEPKNFTAEELNFCVLKANTEFYSLRSILKRFFYNFRHPYIFLSINFSFKRQIKKIKLKNIKKVNDAF